ncbi:glycoside hydrolase family 30 protein [Dyadobacter diqingensis]|uniref:glycoside hydrolase family 30 protein n=1 Tax=Dyadobacter diqingensis TaxID=2938121 RepID=UPI0020C1B232|nr:glycoside hydrolase family 30 beta sandwich domain-containing protein [Dyadobacter diqingensis]
MNNRYASLKLLFLTLSLFSFNFCNAQSQKGISFWLTNTDGSALFEKQKTGPVFVKKADAGLVIEINEKEKYQQIDGFGFTLTGGSASHLIKMRAQSRAALLKELFSVEGNNIGISYLRVSIGASDLNETVFSYNDLPGGQTDTDLKQFDLGPDKKDVIPVLREILAINSKIKILGSPWSPPVWMKDNNDTRGGSLKPEFYGAYANYLVRYIQEMKKEGIRIDAITVQNEPLHPGNNPSLLMLAKDQAVFVKNNLGPAFKSAEIDTKIIIYDHNADRPDYPISILDDPEAKKYIDGSAFHLYGGKIEALSEVHKAHPDKNLYFTEQWMGGPGNLAKDFPDHIKKLTIGSTRNWSRTVLEWNLSSDPEYKPFTDRGGCNKCLGGITIDQDQVTRNPAYYVVAHASKFVRPGSVRIASNYLDKLPNVAFKTPDGKKVLIVLNDTDTTQSFTFRDGKKVAGSTLKPGSVGTYVW